MAAESPRPVAGHRAHRAASQLQGNFRQELSCEKNRYNCRETRRYKAIFSRVALADATARSVEDGDETWLVEMAKVALADATTRSAESR
jgi:hypothetical protein